MTTQIANNWNGINHIIRGRLCPCGVASEGARHILDGCVCAPGCHCIADGLGVDAPEINDILWRRTPVDYGVGEPDTADCVRDPALPLDCPACGVSLYDPGLGMHRAICRECGHDLVLTRIGRQRLERGAPPLDMDVYDDRYDARSGMRGLIDWDDGYRMD